MLSRYHVACVLTVSALMLSSLGVHAHHSPTMFDNTKVASVTGAVTRYEWVNPHVYLYIEQVAPNGERIEWQIEGGPPATMRRMGWSKDTLRPGDVLTVSGPPSKTPGSKSILASDIKRADATLFDRTRFMKQLSSVELPEIGTKTIAGTWTSVLSMPLMRQNVFPDASQLTSIGREAFERFDEKTMNPGINCVNFTAPGMMVNPDLKRISFAKDVVYIESDLDGARRTVHLNATHDGGRPSIHGHSIGKWEGTSLVVDTTHFAYHSIGNGFGVPSGARKRLVEKFTLNPDGKTLTYHFEVHDPEFLTTARSGDAQWVYSPKAVFAPEKCNLENARRFTTD